MKIIKCEIFNFGKLSDFTLDFTDGQNTFCQMNGWGKSTLSAFMRGMFYGFEGDGKRKNELENERKRYAPWQGGTYGGKLIIAAGGKEYLITRTFGSKKGEDTFECRDYKTNLVCDDFTENIGEELFGVDKASFQRTVFIAQSDVKTESTDSMNAKLGTGNGIMGDLDKYTKADNTLKDLLNKIAPTMKKGSAHQLKDQITSLNTEIKAGSSFERDIKTVEIECQNKKEELLSLQKQLAELNNLQMEVSKKTDLQAKKAVYEEKKKSLYDAESNLEEKRKTLPENIPSSSELEKALNAGMELNTAKSAYDSVAMLPDQVQDYSALDLRFSNGFPSEQEFIEIKDLAWSLKDAEKQRQINAIPQEDIEKLHQFEMNAGVSANPGAEAEKIGNLYSQRKDIEKESTDTKLNYKTPMIFAILLAVLGIASAAAGLFTSLSTIAKTPLVAAGAVLFIVGIVLLILASNIKKKYDYQLIKKSELADIDDELANAFEIFGEEYQAGSLDYVVQKIYRKADDLVEIIREKNKPREFENVDTEAIKRKLEAFFEKYNAVRMPRDDEETISKLKMDVNTYIMLKERYDKHRDSENKYKTAKEIYEKKLDELNIYDSVNSLDEIRKLQSNLADYNNALSVREKALAEVERMDTENPELKELCDEVDDVKSLEEITSQIEAVTEKIDECKGKLKDDEERIENIQEQLEVIEAKKVELAEKEEKYAAQKNAFDKLSITRELLKTAKENLTGRYTEPLMKSFREYYELVTGENAEKFYMDANTQITYEEKGYQREASRLSFGYQDLIGVCQRFAYIDAMYDEELPFLVLDDPFVNLDGPNLKGAKKLLDRLSKKYQIIYFTCHEDREI